MIMKVSEIILLRVVFTGILLYCCGPCFIILCTCFELEKMKNIKKTSRYFAIWISALFILGATAEVMACSTCSSEYTKEKLDAYLGITLLLISLPMFGIGGLIFFFWRKNRNKSLAESGDYNKK